MDRRRRPIRFDRHGRERQRTIDQHDRQRRGTRPANPADRSVLQQAIIACRLKLLLSPTRRAAWEKPRLQSMSPPASPPPARKFFWWILILRPMPPAALASKKKKAPQPTLPCSAKPRSNRVSSPPLTSASPSSPVKSICVALKSSFHLSKTTFTALSSLSNRSSTPKLMTWC